MTKQPLIEQPPAEHSPAEHSPARHRYLPGDPTPEERAARRLRREQAARQVLESLEAGRHLARSGAAGRSFSRPAPRGKAAASPSPEDAALLNARVRPSLLHPALGAAGFLTGLGSALLSEHLAETHAAAWRDAAAALRREEAPDSRMTEAESAQVPSLEEPAPLRDLLSLGARALLKVSERI